MTEKKKHILRLMLIAFGILLAVMISGAAVLLAARPDLRFRLADRFGLGKEKAVVASAGVAGTDNSEKVDFEEFVKWDNVTFDQSLMLINPQYPIKENFTFDIAEYNNSGVEMNTCIMESYKQLADRVNSDHGVKLYIMSSVRTYEEQQEIAEEKGSDTAAAAGTSEHETGLALDVYVTNYAGDGFLKSEAGRFVNSNCWEYGFIIRYPQNGQDITGIRYEPWHIRYVGFPHSEIIYRNSLTFEEYIDTMNVGEIYSFDDYVFTRQQGDELNVPTGCESYVVSPDNTGCYIITGKRSGKDD